MKKIEKEINKTIREEKRGRDNEKGQRENKKYKRNM